MCVWGKKGGRGGGEEREREREGYETFFHKHSAGFELTELEAKRIVKLEARPS